MKQEKRIIIREEDQEDLSLYGKFHFKCLGFNFQNIDTGKIYTKGELWDAFRAQALYILKRHGRDPFPPIGFRLVPYSHEHDTSDVLRILSYRVKKEKKHETATVLLQ